MFKVSLENVQQQGLISLQYCSRIRGTKSVVTESDSYISVSVIEYITF